MSFSNLGAIGGILLLLSLLVDRIQGSTTIQFLLMSLGIGLLVYEAYQKWNRT